MKKQWKVAAYLRLSNDDGQYSESMSIVNQKSLISEWLKDKPDLCFIDFYSDDGYTGTNFDRPAFKDLMFDLKIGRVDCVVVKDLSRLGRNSTKVGELLDEFFPINKIRFIAINDNLDTLGLFDDNDVTGFKLICNEFYVRDTSKKVKSALRASAKQGNYVGALAPYGYKKSDKNYHRLVVDEESAKIVKRIFLEYAGGKSGRQIAEQLNKENVLSPSNYRNSVIGNDGKPHIYWCSESILQILHNEVYFGNLVQHKREKLSYKLKTRRVTSEEERIISYNTHEAIIDKELELAVKARFDNKERTKERKRKNGELVPVLFSGLLRCADCGSKMAGTIKNNKRCYRCQKYNTSGKSACSSHFIYEEDLLKLVMFDIRTIVYRYKREGESFVNFLVENLTENISNESERVKLTLKSNNEKIIDIESKMDLLYNDKKSGTISTRMFSILSKKYDDELNLLMRESEKCETVIQKINSDSQIVFKWINSVIDLSNESNPEFTHFNSIIDKIYVEEVGKSNRIRIRYKVGYIDLDKKMLKIA